MFSWLEAIKEGLAIAFLSIAIFYAAMIFTVLASGPVPA